MRKQASRVKSLPRAYALHYILASPQFPSFSQRSSLSHEVNFQTFCTSAYELDWEVRFCIHIFAIERVNGGINKLPPRLNLQTPEVIDLLPLVCKLNDA